MDSFSINSLEGSRNNKKEDLSINILHKTMSPSLNNYCRFLTKSPKYPNKNAFKWNFDYTQRFSLNSTSIEKLSQYCSAKGGPRITLDYVKQSQILSTKVSPSDVSNYMGYESNKKNVKCFFDGTCYIGDWNALGFAGRGIYKYPHGVIYDGEFNQNGQFHGQGTLIYPNGHRIEGTWDKGKMCEDVTYFNKPDAYSRKDHHLPDRRYPIEVDTHMGAPGDEHVTSEHPSKPLADGCFDVGDGVYIKSKNCTMHHKDFGNKMGPKHPICPSDEELYSPLYEATVDEESYRLLDSLKCKPKHCFFLNDYFDVATLTTGEADIKDIPGSKKEEWIKKYCRSGADNPIGFAPELYEVFTTGAKEELENIQNRKIRNTYYVEELLEKSEDYVADTPMMFAIRYPEKPKYFRRKTLSDDTKLTKKFVTMRTKKSKDSEFNREVSQSGEANKSQQTEEISFG